VDAVRSGARRRNQRRERADVTDAAGRLVDASERGRMSVAPLAIVAPVAVVVLMALVAWLRPAWVFPVVVVAIPLRLPFFPSIEIATLVLLGAVLGRAAAIVAVVQEEPGLFAATIALPAWFVASAVWARQPSFVFGAAAKWFVIWLAMALVVADDTLRPMRVVLSMLVSMVPMALWGAGERLRLIPPLGDPKILRYRAIDLIYMIRGRALFWHPNRLAEFVEQVGLLLVGSAMGGLLPALCLLGALVAVFGIWGTDSKAGMATMIGGALVTVAWLQMSSQARRRTLVVALLAVAAAVGVAVWEFRAHGGIGTRVLVYHYAWHLIETHPILGVGGGNWALAISAAPLEVSRFWFRSHAHSLALQLTVEVGVIGLLLGVLFFAAPLSLGARRLSGAAPEWRGIVYGAMAGVIGLLVHNIVHYFLRDAADGILSGVLLGLVVAGARRRAAAVA
jgi:hypothetical protein